MKVQTCMRNVMKYLLAFLVGSLWALIDGLLIYVSIVWLLPFLVMLVVQQFPFPVDSDNTLDVILLMGGPVICFSVLFAVGVCKWLKQSVTLGKKMYRYLGVKLSIFENTSNAESTLAVWSRKKRIVVSIFCLAVIAACIVGGIWFGKSDGEPSVDTGTYPTVESKGLTSEIDDVDTSKLNVVSDVTSVMQSVKTSIEEYQAAEAYGCTVQLGFDVSNASAVNTLVQYAEADMGSHEISTMLADSPVANGVFYDMRFEQDMSDAGDVRWHMYTSYDGTEYADYADGMDMVYADAYLYLSNLPDAPGKKPQYAYSAALSDGSENFDLTGKNLITDSLLHAVLFNQISDSRMACYTDKSDGLCYYMLSDVCEGNTYDTVRKTVLAEPLLDGQYCYVITYSLVDGDTTDTMVIRVVTDVTDITVTVPAADDVYFVSKQAD